MGEKGDLKSFRSSFSRVDREKLRLQLDFKCTIYRGREIVDYFEDLHSLRLFRSKQLYEWFEAAGFDLLIERMKGVNKRLLLRKRQQF